MPPSNNLIQRRRSSGLPAAVVLVLRRPCLAQLPRPVVLSRQLQWHLYLVFPSRPVRSLLLCLEVLCRRSLLLMQTASRLCSAVDQYSSNHNNSRCSPLAAIIHQVPLEPISRLQRPPLDSVRHQIAPLPLYPVIVCLVLRAL